MKILNNLDSLDNVKDGETRKLITKTTSSGSGNVVSAVSVSGDTITYTKGVTALTAHQNAFSNVKVGSTTVAADSAGDTLELVAGSNVTLTPDSTNDKVTIAATDTTYESKAAASGGTDISLVTTGEKYTWNNKQNALSTQTAYSAKGTATKVPQITTNTLGQVTKIEEVTITQPTVNNGTLTIQKNGTDVQTFSANQSSNVTANITVPTKTSDITNDSNFLVNGNSYLNIHPENGPVVIPFINNDIAFLKTRGGDYTVEYDGVTQTQDISAVFNGCPNYWAINPTGITEVVITLTLHKTFAWSNWIYCDFGSSGWRSKNIKIEVINTNYAEDTWVTKLNKTGNDKGNIAVSVSHTPVGASNAGGGFNKVRFTFSSWNSATIFRIAQLGIYNYGSSGVRETSMSRGIDDYVFRNITPNFNTTYDLGSSDRRWNNIYGNAISASGNITATNGDILLTKGANTGGQQVKWTVGTNDYARIYGAATASNAGYLEIATADDSNEPIYARQYSGSFGTLTRTATLLDASGNTSFPGTVTATNFTGLASKATGDKNGDDITTTYYKASNPNGYTSNTGTITKVQVNGTDVASSGTANITSVPASILTGAIPSAVTATTQSQGNNSTKIATTAYVDTAIDNLPEPMVFKGSLGTGGTITTLPVNGSATIGDTYKVITDGTYASQAAKVGDTFICDSKTSSANTWVLIPSGDDAGGTVTSIKIQATSPIAIDNDTAITTSGTRTLSHVNSGVTAGTYKSVTVNATGHVTAGTNPTTLSGYGITDAKIENGVITLGSNTITPLTSEVNSNIRNGSADYSLRTTGSKAEGTSYTIGQYAFAEGYATQASGKYSHAEGDRTIASNQRAHAEGVQTQASANASHAEGNETIASQGYAHAEGSKTRATSFGDHAEGCSTRAAGGYSHAEGYYTMAYGSYSHAEGQHNTDADLTGVITSIDSTNLKVSVSGIPRLTIGDYKYQLCGTATDWDVDCYITDASYASNIYTFTVSKWNSSFAAQGTFKIFLRPVAYGNGSHAEGQATYAFSDVTHAEGLGTVTSGKAQHVQGKWNVISSTYADIVGNGTDNANRSNAYTLDWEGNGIYAGKVTVGIAPTNNMDVATKKYVDDNCVDTKNTAGSTDTSSKIYLIGATSQAANPQTYSDNEVYATSGVLTTKSVQVGGTAATMQYNSTDKCIEFIFS